MYIFLLGVIRILDPEFTGFYIYGEVYSWSFFCITSLVQVLITKGSTLGHAACRIILASEDGGAASAGQLIKRYLYLWLFTDLPLIIAGRLMSVRVAFIIDLIILRLTASSLKNRKLVTVKWKKQSAKMAKARITGYQIQLATDGNFTKNKRTKTVKGYRNTSKKVTNLKAKKKYYIRIRTYKKTGKKTYWSKWSKLQTVTP